MRNKIIVNLDNVERFFEDGDRALQEMAEIESKGKIRKVMF